MKCQKCGRHDATNHITKIINGKKSEVFLCPFCAELQDDITKSVFDFGHDFAGLFPTFFHLDAPKNHTANLVCPNCHTTLSDIQKRGHLGCSECYSVFFDYIKKPIREIHGFTKHVGKVPKKFTPNPEKADILSDLKRKLEDAVAIQNFEEAAVIRDKIKEFEKKEG